MAEILQGNFRDFSDEFLEIVEKYKEYTVDTIVVKQGHSIRKTVDAFVKDWELIHEESEKPDKSSILDCYNAELCLKINQEEMESIYARCPTPESYPRISELIEELVGYKRN